MGFKMQKILLLLLVSFYIHACEKFDLSAFPLTWSIINSSPSIGQKEYVQQYVTSKTRSHAVPNTTIPQNTQNYVVLSIYIFIQAHKNKSLRIAEKSKLLDESAQALTQSFGWLRKPVLCKQDCSAKTFFATIENVLWWETQIQKVPFAKSIINHVGQSIKQISSLYHYFSFQ